MWTGRGRAGGGQTKWQRGHQVLYLKHDLQDFKFKAGDPWRSLFSVVGGLTRHL